MASKSGDSESIGTDCELPTRTESSDAEPSDIFSTGLTNFLFEPVSKGMAVGLFVA